MLNTMIENESNSSTNISIPFLRSCSQHMLWTWYQETDQNISENILFIFSHSMEHDEVSGYIFSD